MRLIIWRSVKINIAAPQSQPPKAWETQKRSKNCISKKMRDLTDLSFYIYQ